MLPIHVVQSRIRDLERELVGSAEDETDAERVATIERQVALQHWRCVEAELLRQERIDAERHERVGLLLDELDARLNTIEGRMGR